MKSFYPLFHLCPYLFRVDFNLSENASHRIHFDMIVSIDRSNDKINFFPNSRRRVCVVCVSRQ